MYKRLTICFLLSLFFHCGFAQSKTDRLATYKHFGQYLQTDLNNWHDLNYDGRLAGLKKRQGLLIGFQVDTSGQVVHIHTVADTGVMPVFKEYAFQLIRLTDGYWTPQVKNCQPVISDTILCQFMVAMPITFEELKQFDQLSLDYPTAPNNKQSVPNALEYFNPLAKNHCQVILKYYDQPQNIRMEF
jgi:hypothetical protein